MHFKTQKKEIRYFIDETLNCLKDHIVELENNNTLADPDSKQMLKSTFLKCSAIVDYIRRKRILKPKHKYTLDTDDNYYFIMIRNILIKARWDLNKITDNPRKFIAINDDMDHSKMIATAVELELKNFYKRLFPYPSQYELQVT
ncbi:N-acetylglucosamine-1-phosphotransferase subunits alpha/beta-like [Ruditapes philippinarum]|uniref:N-acetylglucosamine-1-phosphotransferase subunits alpha/beta-like n=1 Tax=Ruditapes philippinarum TaxID=129788 RepID=UPI00295C054F|nr:N-acetylglucosamine-1-phosphotransferase subunits alpha/beta-like [Ruditapes philippinarum]